MNISSAISCCCRTAWRRPSASACIRSASARSLSAAALCSSTSPRISSAARRASSADFRVSSADFRMSSADFRVSSANRRNDFSVRRVSSETVLSSSEATRPASASSCCWAATWRSVSATSRPFRPARAVLAACRRLPSPLRSLARQPPAGNSGMGGRFHCCDNRRAQPRLRFSRNIGAAFTEVKNARLLARSPNLRWGFHLSSDGASIFAPATGF